jgi:predicted MFS family arabinose efflux permease
MPHRNIAHPGSGLSAALTLLFAVATGAMVGTLYYAQPLLGPIARDLHMAPRLAGLLVTVTQLGYVIGLLFIVPLGDRVENRHLVLGLLIAVTAALALTALAQNAAWFLVAAILVGIASCAVQILVPMAASLATPARRGEVVGNVMAGLLLGILLARPAASVIAYIAGWRAVFAIAAALMAALLLLLLRFLPRIQPTGTMPYPALIGSMLRLYATEPVLRRRALYQCAAFGTFSLFWTAVPLLLAHDFHLNQLGIALFALVGAAGAASAPIAGRLADRGHSQIGTAASLGSIIIAFALSALAVAWHNLILLAAAGILLDIGVQANNVLGQRAIYSLAPTLRARLNGAYMAAFFVGGATGSALGSQLLLDHGWPGIALAGMIAPACALTYLTIHLIQARVPRQQPG